MVKIINILYAIVKQIEVIMPKSTHELGEYSGDKDTFCYYLVFSNSNRNTKHTKEVLVDIQIIYHAKSINYVGRTSLKEKLEVQEKLETFLSQFILRVDDRVLKFDSDIGEADGELMVNLSFRFFDGMIDLTYDEEQAREIIQNIIINNEVI